MYQGKIIEYIDQGRFVCTVCLQDKGSSLQLLTASNREVKLSPKRAVIISESSLNISNKREALLEALRSTDKARNYLVKEVNIKELWELTKDEEEQFGKKDLAQLVFGNAVADDHLSALVRALFEERLHFKMKDGHFLPNSEERIEQILRQREEEAARAEMLGAGGKWLKEIHEGKPAKDPPQKENIVKLLTQLALYGNDANDAKVGKELLSRAGVPDIQMARDLLILLGVWEEDENLDLLRSGIESSFTEAQLLEASGLAKTTVNFEGREDLRDLSVLTIDGPYTLDFDDAVSLEWDNDIIRLGVHIADVASTIPPGSILDLEASKRGVSLYLPRREIPMIPHSLSHQALSLLEGSDRPAISLFADFEKSGKLLKYRFAPTVIRVSQKLIYEKVDEILGAEAVGQGHISSDAASLEKRLNKLLQISRQLQQERMNHDALRISLPEIQVVFNEDTSFNLTQDDQDTPSRMIIAELMILYNRLAAKFCRDNLIPVLYRTQAEPSERLPDDDLDYIFYVLKQRRKLSPVYVETSASRHSGLGLDAYVQATSPIRRYLDLVVQRQIRNHLMGEHLVYSKKMLEEIRGFVEPAIKDFQNIKRNRIRYWILKYLSRQRGVKYRALVLDEFRRKYRIVLRDFFLVAEINKREGVILKPGDEILVKVTKADPRDDMLGLEYAE